MKIAVACDGNKVSGHFGYCEHFLIFKTEGERILSAERVSNPGHRPGYLPDYLSRLGIDVIVSGGMGGSAVGIFSEKGIEVLTGVDGKAEEVVKAYLTGTLERAENACSNQKNQ